MLLLYSTNTYMKFRIQRDHFADHHYCWCSPHFDSRKLASYDPGADRPLSSDPCGIYEDLAQGALIRPDGHHAKITDQKKNLSALAIKKFSDGQITADDRDEILTLIEMSNARDWRPLLYIIPSAPVLPRLQMVDRRRRASLEKEYIIEDLKRSEFEIVEFPHAR